MSLQGIWKSEGYAGESEILEEEFIFFGDKFIFLQRDLSPYALPVGVESGVFVTKSDGSIELDIQFDGLWGANGRRDGFDNADTMHLDVALNESKAQLKLGGDDGFLLSKVAPSPASSELFGLWYFDVSSAASGDDRVYVLFLDDGTFLAATPIAQTSYATYTGLEIGEYTLSDNSARLSVELEYDGATLNSQDLGFSVTGGTFKVQIEGDKAELISETNDLTYVLTRLFTEDLNSSDDGSAAQPEDGSYSLTVIVDVLGQRLILKDLVEQVTGSSHTIEVDGQIYQYAAVDPFITTVARDGEFTQEFLLEIAESFPHANGITYGLALSLIGVANWDATLLAVAGADGNYIG
jgi:hypothetical protein